MRVSSLNRAMTISVEPNEIESTTKGSDSILQSRKNTTKYDHIYLTVTARRGMLPKRLGKSSRYTFGSSDLATNFSLFLYSMYS